MPMVPQAGGDDKPVRVNLEAASFWLDTLHGDSSGYVHVCSTGNWNGLITQNRDEALAYIRLMDEREAQGIYVRATTLSHKPASGRGGEGDTACLAGLWADVDIEGPGHKTDKPLPKTPEQARQIVIQSGLPEPTLWIHSGGGLYPWWLLTEPACPEDLDRVKVLSQGWHKIIAHSAEQLGWHYSTETADLSRVLRIPGTINRKIPEQPAMVRVIGDWGCGVSYPIEELYRAEQVGIEGLPGSSLPTVISAPSPAIPHTSQSTGLSPGDDFEARHPWGGELLLGGAGWSVFKDHGHGYVEWTRPGKNRREGSSATTGHDPQRDRLFVFSSSTPFQPHTPYNKFAAYSILYHGGDYAAAAGELRRLGYGDKSQEIVTTPEPLPLPSSPAPIEGKVQTPQSSPRKNRSGFITREGLLAKSLWDAVQQEGLFAVDKGRSVYQYEDGVWHRNREWVVRRVTQEILGEDYRMAHASTVVDMFRNQDPLFTDDTADTTFINVPNGLLDWQTGKLHPHTPDVPSMNRIPVRWNPDATCPQIDEWVQNVVPEDCIETIYEIAGYCLYNGNPFHKAIMLHAQGRNGKGTFIRLLATLLGRDNITAQSPQSLDTNRFRAAELYGTLANLVGDVDPRMFTETAMFKQLTGEDMVGVERKNKDPFKMVCRSLMVCSFNELPTSADATIGFFSRWIVIPFTGYFPPGVANTKIEQQLHETGELEGFLVRAIEGLQRLMSRPDFAVSENANQATERFRLMADPVRAFLAEQKESVEESGFTPRNQMYQLYESWAMDNGYKHPLTAAKFYQRVENCSMEVLGAQLIDRKRQGTRGFVGIQLSNPSNPSMAWAHRDWSEGQ